MYIGELCNPDVVTIERDKSVRKAAELMRQYHVGDIVVVEEKHHKNIPIGIVTDRDIVIEVLALGVNPDELAVQDLIIDSLLVAHTKDSLLNVLQTMQEKGVRRVPVVDDANELVGIITFDDIIALLSGMLYHLVGIVERQQKMEEEMHY